VGEGGPQTRETRQPGCSTLATAGPPHSKYPPSYPLIPWGASGGGSSSGGGSGARSGDWTCRGCSNSCFAWRDTCPRCGAHKPPEPGGGRAQSPLRGRPWHDPPGVCCGRPGAGDRVYGWGGCSCDGSGWRGPSWSTGAESHRLSYEAGLGLSYETRRSRRQARRRRGRPGGAVALSLAAVAVAVVGDVGAACLSARARGVACVGCSVCGAGVDVQVDLREVELK
jgi:hypothetical protein